MWQNPQVVDPQVQRAIESFLGAGLPEPVFVRALLLANSRGYGHVLTLQFMAATAAPPGPVDWKVLGCSSAERSSTLVAELMDLAQALEDGREEWDSSCITSGSLRDARVYAVVHAQLEVPFADLVEVLGAAVVADRLREFACALRLAAMVG